MATKAHKLLTGTDLHEPKGVETATAGQAYIANGAGSGVWTTISTDIGVSTGDLKLTLKYTADPGWVLANDGTLGNAASGATCRASADTLPLFTLIWTIVSNTDAPIQDSSGVATTRGGTALADFNANKRLPLPRTLGRALGVAGSGSGLTGRVMGQAVGEESHTLTAAESAILTYVSIDSGHSHAYGDANTKNNPANQSSPSTFTLWGGGVASGNTSNGAAVITTQSNAGGGSHNNMQPTTFFNLMVKL